MCRGQWKLWAKMRLRRLKANAVISELPSFPFQFFIQYSQEFFLKISRILFFKITYYNL